MADFAVIFDMDGLLLDTEQLVLRCWLEAAADWKLEDLTDTFYRCVGCNKARTHEILCEAYGADFPMAEFDARVHEVYLSRVAKDGIPIKRGAMEILRSLKEHGIPAAVGSSTRVEVVKQELALTGLLPYFSAVVGGDLVARSKPAPDVFLAAAEMLGFSPAVCYVLEDSHNGIRAASAAGMHPIMVPDLLPPTEEITTLAEAVFPSLAEAKEYLLLLT